MNILFVLGEIDPQRPNGAAATALGAAKGLRGLGHKVTAVAPLLRGIDPIACALARRLTKLHVEVAAEQEALEVYTGRTSGGLDLVLLGHPELFGSVDSLLSGTPAEAARRLAAFAAGAERYVAANDGAYDALEAFGIAGAAAVSIMARDPEAGGPVRVLAVDDPSAQGILPLEQASTLGLGPDARDVRHVNVLKAGLLAAERITMPCSAIGRKLASDASEPGLAAAMARAGERVHVIVPGIDGSVWNPLTDPQLPSRFDPIDRSGKARCRSVISKELGLPVRADAPLLGVIAEAKDGRGLRAFADVARRVLRTDVLVVVAARGDGDEVFELEELRERWPDRIAVVRNADESFVHRLLGAADLLLRPSALVPGDFFPIAALRYGALPIVHREATAADAVVDCDPTLRTGTGFLFDALDEESLLGVIRRAVSTYGSVRAFEAVQQRAMRLDYSVERNARVRERVYREAQRARTEPQPTESEAG